MSDNLRLKREVSFYDYFQNLLKFSFIIDFILNLVFYFS
jgi:hypothetical protein